MNTCCPSCYENNSIEGSYLTEQCVCKTCGHSLFDGQLIQANTENFSALLNDDLPVLVDFSIAGCGPCQDIEPILTSIACEQAQTLRCLKVDADKSESLANQFNINGYPTIKLFHKGNVLATLDGALPRQAFEQWLATSLEQIK